MRIFALCFLFALALGACGSDKTTTEGDPGRPPGDPGGQTGDTAAPGDPGVQGDELPGDPGLGDPGGGDPGGGDPGGPTVVTPSTQFCAAGGKVSSSSYEGIVCLSPLGSGGQISTSSSYKWIPGPAHIVGGE